MRGRTVVLVSHHVQLCAPGAKYIVSLDNGRVQYSGNYDGLQSSGVLKTLIQSEHAAEEKEDTTAKKDEEIVIEDAAENIIHQESAVDSEASSTAVATTTGGDAKPDRKQKAPRKLIEEEKRAVGRIGKDIWAAYFTACGSYGYWLSFVCSLGLAALSPVLENGWLRVWSGAYVSAEPRSPSFYIGVYSAVGSSSWFPKYDLMEELIDHGFRFVPLFPQRV